MIKESRPVNKIKCCRPGQFALKIAMLTTMVVLLLLPQLGCAAASSSETPATQVPDSTTTVQAGSDPMTAPVRGDSGLLRLWWSPRDELNPLLDHSSSGQAVQTLIFQSLFERDPAWNLQPILVRNFSFSVDRLQLTLILNDAIYFHDGQKLSASDVLANLNFIKLMGEQSPYFADLNAYSSGRIMNDSTLVLQLSEPDADFLYALDFPVLPANQLELPAGSLIAGTGRYKMTEFSTDKILTLTWAGNGSDQQASLQRIKVKPYATATEAMKAVEDDQLDLAFLAENDLNNYEVRSSLRLDRFIGRHYVYLALNESTVASSNDDRRFIDLKYLLRSSRWYALPEPWPGQASDLPIPAFHACFNRHPLDFESVWPDMIPEQTTTLASESSTATPVKPVGRVLRIIAPESQQLLVKIAGQSRKFLLESGRQAEVEILTPELYRAALADHSFDLAVCESVIPASTEPGWLLQDIPDAFAQQTQGLPATGLNSYDGDQSGLAKGWPFFGLLGVARIDDPEAAAALAAEYRSILTQSALRSPYVGILLRESAVAYGDRVQGQCVPSLNQPYRGIEDLWIWSGLSS